MHAYGISARRDPFTVVAICVGIIDEKRPCIGPAVLDGCAAVIRPPGYTAADSADLRAYVAALARVAGEMRCSCGMLCRRGRGGRRLLRSSGGSSSRGRSA